VGSEVQKLFQSQIPPTKNTSNHPIIPKVADQMEKSSRVISLAVPFLILLILLRRCANGDPGTRRNQYTNQNI